ncbi:hypothetical protein A6K24_16625 [Metabacillus litoralis]|uniref:Uncharacterized protein n=2 Tax=Metabacillus TaxID=2675233 RepID=A0A179T4K2_9BACI|nr:hypothetical protein A6K24_16625 [Metabacillus litoralis]
MRLSTVQEFYNFFKTIKNKFAIFYLGIVFDHIRYLKSIQLKGDEIMDRRNLHSEVTPHPDGEKESIINDPLSTAGSQIGIKLDADPEFTQEKNPFDHQFKPNPTMAPFEKLMSGKKVEE